MKNKQCTKLVISRFIDGDMDECEYAETKRHLEACPGCKAVLSQYQKLHTVLISAKTTRRFAAVKKVRNAFPIPLWRLSGTAVALVLLAVIIVNVFAPPKHAFNLMVSREESSLFDTPLGSMVYYEELAGNIVHAQYSTIASVENGGAGLSEASAGYTSPLFCDSSITERQFSSFSDKESD